jgi:hypothetical protein
VIADRDSTKFASESVRRDLTVVVGEGAAVADEAGVA